MPNRDGTERVPVSHAHGTKKFSFPNHGIAKSRSKRQSQVFADAPLAGPATQKPATSSDTIRAGLRRATPADASAVRDLTRAAYARWVPVIGREPGPMNADYDLAVR